MPVECYIPLRGSTVTENVRATEDYKDKCCEAVGLGAEIDVDRYAHLAAAGAAEPVAAAETAGAAAAADKAVGVRRKAQDELGKSQNIHLLRWLVRRGSDCMCLPETPRTTVKGYRHRLITKGPPVRVGLHRLSRPDSELVERHFRRT